MKKAEKSEQKDYTMLKKAAKEISVLFVLIASLFVIVSFYSEWTGTFGRTISDFLIKYAGGALVIPLCFVIYICIVHFISREVPNKIRQSLATLLL